MSLADLTHDGLDQLAAAHDVADYPASGNKDEKVAALTAADVPAPAAPETKARQADVGGPMVVINGVRYRREDAERVQNKARTARNKRRG